jgi:hypothetical protein
MENKRSQCVCGPACEEAEARRAPNHRGIPRQRRASGRAGMKLTITGTVQSIDTSTCGASVDIVSGAQLVFKDQSVTVVGTATAGQATTKSASSGIVNFCGRAASYSVSVAKEAFYQVTWVGVDATPRTVSYQDLSAKGFVYDVFSGSTEGFPAP